MASKVLKYNLVDVECIRCNDKLDESDSGKHKISQIFYKTEKTKKLWVKIQASTLVLGDDKIEISLNTAEKGKAIYNKFAEIDNKVMDITKKKISNKKWFKDAELDDDSVVDMFSDTIRASENGRVLTLKLNDSTKLVDSNNSNILDNNKAINSVRNTQVKATVIIELSHLMFKKSKFSTIYTPKLIKLNSVLIKDDESDYEDEDKDDNILDPSELTYDSDE